MRPAALSQIFGAALAGIAGFTPAAQAATLNFVQPNDGSGRMGYLALNNTGGSTVTVTITARDDLGVAAPGGALTLSLAPRQSRYLSSTDLELGKTSVMSGALGNGTGYWHLDITATGTITAQNFLYTADGALNELTTPLTAESDGSYLVKFFTEPSASVFTSKLRLRNLSAQSGVVTVTARNAAGDAVAGSAQVNLGALRAVELTAADLAQGNSSLGVTGSLGRGDGFWILSMSSNTSVAAIALAQAGGGQLADIGSGLTITGTAPVATCPTSKFLTLTAHPRNTAYPAPTQSVSCSNGTVTVTSNGIPNFEFVQTTPNRLQAQNNTYRFPVTPTVATTKTEVPLGGPAAVTVGGLPIFGPTESPQDGYRDPIRDDLQDDCNGHTAQRGDYHHHSRPVCLYPNAAQQTGLVLGYAFDGYPILHPYECTNTACTSVYKVRSSYEYIGGSQHAWESNRYVEGRGHLDRCNGMTRPDGTYAYYATDEFPYIIGCYHGVVNTSNFTVQP
jgi:hypothetical protein